MSRAQKRLKEEGFEKDAYLLLSVHDELIYEIKKGKEERITKIIKEEMENVIPPSETGGFKFKAEVIIGANWGELK